MTLQITGGIFKGRRIQTIASNATRPTTEILRQAVFNKLQHVVEDAVFLDLYAGSGSMGIEALSRGAKKSVFVEMQRNTSNVIKKNIKTLELEEFSEVFVMDACRAIDHLIKKEYCFDLVYIDPPYGDAKSEKKSAMAIMNILKAIDSSSLLNAGGKILLEFTSYFDEEEAVNEKATLENLKWLQSKKYGRSTLYTIA
ncbi:MAG: hypothetical protein S4CHLAM37_01050 [Chlamydiia bacterium]|nr:hypothetical protein [Chlamydiia bacterium]